MDSCQEIKQADTLRGHERYGGLSVKEKKAFTDSSPVVWSGRRIGWKCPEGTEKSHEDGNPVFDPFFYGVYSDGMFFTIQKDWVLETVFSI